MKSKLINNIVKAITLSEKNIIFFLKLKILTACKRERERVNIPVKLFNFSQHHIQTSKSSCFFKRTSHTNIIYGNLKRTSYTNIPYGVLFKRTSCTNIPYSITYSIFFGRTSYRNIPYSNTYGILFERTCYTNIPYGDTFKRTSHTNISYSIFFKKTSYTNVPSGNINIYHSHLNKATGVLICPCK